MSDLQLFSAAPSASSPFDAIRRVRPDGSEYWSARDMQPLMGYSRWQSMSVPLNRAQSTARNQGLDLDREFAQVSQVTRSGNLGDQAREDYELSRMGAYLLAMNGDPNKPEVAAAQLYFAGKTREAELAQHRPEREVSRKDLALMVVAAEEERERLTKELETAKPKAEYVDSFVNGTSDATTMRVLANQLRIGEQELRGLLVEKKAIYRKLEGNRWSRTQGRMVAEYSWHAYATFKEWFVERDQPEAPRYHNGQMRTTLYVTPVGKVKIAELVRNRGAA